MANFTMRELKRRRHRLERRLNHLRERVDGQPKHVVSYDIAEAEALQTALVLFDEEIERQSSTSKLKVPLG